MNHRTARAAALGLTTGTMILTIIAACTPGAACATRKPALTVTTTAPSGTNTPSMPHPTVTRTGTYTLDGDTDCDAAR